MDLFNAVNAAMQGDDDEEAGTYEPPTREVEHLTYAARSISSAGYMIGHLNSDEYDDILETLAGLMSDILAIDGVIDNYIGIASGEYQAAMFHKVVQATDGDGGLGSLLAGLDMDDVLNLDDLDD